LNFLPTDAIVFEWMFEGYWVGYAVLGVLAIISLLIWWTSRKQAFLYAVGVFLVLILGYALLDRAVETDREQIEQRLKAMGRAVKDRKPDVILSNVSDDFHYGTMNKKAFQARVTNALDNREVRDLILWDFEFPSEGRTENSRPVHFKAKPFGTPIGDDNPGFIIKSHFDRDKDGQWRLKDFEVYGPTDINTPLTLP
jgi:hypothetical protein